MSVIRKTPAVGCKGMFRVLEPFVCRTDAAYTAIAVSTFADLRRREIDPYETYYRPLGIPVAKFSADSDAGVLLVTLDDGLGSLISVPDSYIESLPSGDMVAYRSLVLSMDLGEFPVSVDPVEAISDAADLLMRHLGIAPVVALTTFPAENVSSEDDLLLENARRAVVAANDSLTMRLERMSAENASLREYIAELEQVIASG